MLCVNPHDWSRDSWGLAKNVFCKATLTFNHQIPVSSNSIWVQVYFAGIWKTPSRHSWYICINTMGCIWGEGGLDRWSKYNQFILQVECPPLIYHFTIIQTYIQPGIICLRPQVLLVWWHENCLVSPLKLANYCINKHQRRKGNHLPTGVKSWTIIFLNNGLYICPTPVCSIYTGSNVLDVTLFHVGLSLLLFFSYTIHRLYLESSLQLDYNSQ